MLATTLSLPGCARQHQLLLQAWNLGNCLLAPKLKFLILSNGAVMFCFLVCLKPIKAVLGNVDMEGLHLATDSGSCKLILVDGGPLSRTKSPPK